MKNFLFSKPITSMKDNEYARDNRQPLLGCMYLSRSTSSEYGLCTSELNREVPTVQSAWNNNLWAGRKRDKIENNLPFPGTIPLHWRMKAKPQISQREGEKQKGSIDGFIDPFADKADSLPWNWAESSGKRYEMEPNTCSILTGKKGICSDKNHHATMNCIELEEWG